MNSAALVAGSVLGGIAGYLIGALLWTSIATAWEIYRLGLIHRRTLKLIGQTKALKALVEGLPKIGGGQ